jgi:hypothetical protein
VFIKVKNTYNNESLFKKVLIIMTSVKKTTINESFLLVMLFLVFNACFSFFSPGWTEDLGNILIEDKTLILEPEKMKDIKPLTANKFIKIGDVEVRTSIGIDPRQLKNICDRTNSTQVNFNLVSKVGDNVLLKYGKAFQCKGISLRLGAEDDFRAVIETSADGIVYSAIKVLKPGATDIELQNEKIKAVRIIVLTATKKPWTLGDISCR